MIENLSDALVLFLNVYNMIALAGGIAIGGHRRGHSRQ